MGTRSLTFVYEEKSRTPIMCMYRQMDGYPSGHGKDLVDFLEPITIVNGIPFLNEPKSLANGAGCLAAQMVYHFKDGQVGGIYLLPTGTKDAGQDYVYKITVPIIDWKGGREFNLDDYKISVTDWNKKVIFRGNFSKFKNFCNNSDD